MKNSNFPKLKVAVDCWHRICFLEKFPDNEEFGWLNDLLDDEYSDFEADKENKPGIYIASFCFTSNGPDWDGEYESYLEVEKLDPIGSREGTDTK